MKIVASIVALNLPVAFATPLVAAEIPTTKAQCEQAGMRWKESANQDKCRFAKARNFPAPVRIVLGIIGLGSTLLGVIILYQECAAPAGLNLRLSLLPPLLRPLEDREAADILHLQRLGIHHEHRILDIGLPWLRRGRFDIAITRGEHPECVCAMRRPIMSGFVAAVVSNPSQRFQVASHKLHDELIVTGVTPAIAVD